MTLKRAGTYSSCSEGTITHRFSGNPVPDLLADEADYYRRVVALPPGLRVANLLSPALAAALLTMTGFHWLFAGTAAGFFASALIVGALTLPSPKPPQRSGGFSARLTAGLRIYLATPSLRGLLALTSLSPRLAR